MSDEDIVKNIVSSYSQKDENKRKEGINSFSLLFSRYEEKLQRYIKRFVYDADDANDILQDVFIKTFQNLNSFDDKYKFNSWIYRITHNECINYLKKNKKEGISFVDLDAIMPILFAKETSDELTLSNENKELIEKALYKLDVKYREVIVLNFFDDLSYEEISDILHIPISTVGVRIKRAKDKLKLLLIENSNNI
ncbi:MAG: polymerase sigma-70 factor, subfamily [Patescibacteria group bacterium]|nr:polymerase sigma-70 factor, subfamily [Patescibacteria group bacterium]